MPSNSDLWQRIQAFAIDNADDEFPFSARLARENGWSGETTSAAIEEYRKFIYLICVSPSPLTPSEVVDQVWHLHLVYTRSYWTSLCEGVLGRAIHHEPTTGGQEQALQFEDQYAQTLSLYEAEFESAPSSQFWPLAPFASLPSQRWGDRRDYWLIPKRAALRGGFVCVAVALIALLASCEDLWAQHQPGAAHAGVTGRIVVLAILFSPFLLMALFGRRPGKDDPGKGCSAGGCGGGCGGHGCCGGGCGGCGGCGG